MARNSGTTHHEPDRGQAAVLVLLVAAAFVALLLSGLATFGLTVRDRTRAQSAADAAALAGLDGGRPAASAVAVANGAALVAWTAGPAAGEVTVTIRLGTQTASARASDAIAPSGVQPPLTGP